jgi:hypothetical protein
VTITAYLLDLRRELREAIPSSTGAYEEFVQKSSEEVHSHLIEKRHALESQGFSSTEAEATAVQEFGPARQVAYGMARAWLPSYHPAIPILLEAFYLLVAWCMAWGFVKSTEIYPGRDDACIFWLLFALVYSAITGFTMLSTGAIRSRRTPPLLLLRLRPKWDVFRGILRAPILLAMMTQYRLEANAARSLASQVPLVWGVVLLCFGEYWVGVFLYTRAVRKMEIDSGVRAG